MLKNIKRTVIIIVSLLIVNSMPILALDYTGEKIEDNASLFKDKSIIEESIKKFEEDTNFFMNVLTFSDDINSTASVVEGFFIDNMTEEDVLIAINTATGDVVVKEGTNISKFLNKGAKEGMILSMNDDFEHQNFESGIKAAIYNAEQFINAEKTLEETTISESSDINNEVEVSDRKSVV